MKIKKGFTLIELLIVLTILAILVAIAYPNYIAARYGGTGLTTSELKAGDIVKIKGSDVKCTIVTAFCGQVTYISHKDGQQSKNPVPVSFFEKCDDKEENKSVEK